MTIPCPPEMKWLTVEITHGDDGEPRVGVFLVLAFDDDGHPFAAPDGGSHFCRPVVLRPTRSWGFRRQSYFLAREEAIRAATSSGLAPERPAHQSTEGTAI